MLTVVCQGIQSCTESQLIEKRILRLKFALSESIALARRSSVSDGAREPEAGKKGVQADDSKHNSSSFELGGLSFIQSLSKTSTKEAEERESSYVPPMAKRSSSSKLSGISFELCTENLGCETGTDIAGSSTLSLSSPDFVSRDSQKNQQPKSRRGLEPKKVRSKSFPPPLTTMSGSNSLQVRAHREGGRLMITAIESPSTGRYLQAERSNGRLRLSFLTESYDSEAETAEQQAEEEEGSRDSEMDECENDVGKQEDEEEEREACGGGGDIGGISEEVGVEMGIEKFQRPSRCKEGGRGSERLLRKWEPFWVATS